MLLSDQTIKRYLEEGIIDIKPFLEEKDIRPTGIRLHLGEEVLVYKEGQVIDPQKGTKIKYKTHDITKKPFILKPGQFIIGHTYEEIKTSKNIIGFLDGRSTLARLGLTTHITAGVIDGISYRYEKIALEIKNVSNMSIKLSYKMPISLLIFLKTDRKILQNMDDKYKNQNRICPPNLEFRIT